MTQKLPQKAFVYPEIPAPTRKEKLGMRAMIILGLVSLAVFSLWFFREDHMGYRPLEAIADNCPKIDIIGINSFGYAPDVQRLLGGITSPWNKPYFFSEWGPQGYWEVFTTDWGASFEPASQEKAAFMQDVYLNHIAPHSQQCLGSFAFLWDFKQERTHTWFSLMNAKGNPSVLLNCLQSLWENEARVEVPFAIDDLQLNDHRNGSNIYLEPREVYEASIRISNPSDQQLSVRWEIRPEGNYRGINGGDTEPMPMILKDAILTHGHNRLSMRTPGKEGAYRLFCYVSNQGGLFSTANLCFFVTHTQ